MAEKTSVKVLIDGRVITLAGYESNEYLQRVAFYLNTKIAELGSSSGYGRLTQDAKSTLLALNIADDYFKAKEQVEALEEDLENKDQNAYEIKHELVSLQVKQEEAVRQISSLKEEAADYQKKIIDLEARLSQSEAGQNGNKNHRR